MDLHSTDDRLLAALPIVDRILAFIRRRNRMSQDEAEDLGSYVRLKLVERSASVFGRFDGRSSLETYLSVIVQRLFLDYRAERRSKSRHPDASRMPPRPGGIGHSADDPLARDEDRAAAGKLETALRAALAGLPEQDRLIVRLHFIEGVPLASVATLLAVRQKPLYRRVERILARLRDELESVGAVSRDVATLIGRREFGVGWPTETGDQLGNAAGGPSKEG